MRAITLIKGIARAVCRNRRHPFTTAIIVAAGNSTRMGGKKQKNLLLVNGAPVLAHTLIAFQNAPNIKEIVVVARAEDVEHVWDLKDTYQISKLTAVTHGGASRAASVARGFAKINPQAKYVAIHDGARCLITPEDILRVSRAAYRHRAATAAVPVTDTVKIANSRGFIASTTDRSKVWLAQTPQVFYADLYRAALALTEADGLTDDNQLMEKIGYPVKLVKCGKHNLKITHPDDLSWAEFILKAREMKQ